jgi:hypothetical protein
LYLPLRIYEHEQMLVSEFRHFAVNLYADSVYRNLARKPALKDLKAALFGNGGERERRTVNRQLARLQMQVIPTEFLRKEVCEAELSEKLLSVFEVEYCHIN